MQTAAPIDAPPQLAFAVEDGGVLDHAAVPTLRFALRISAGERVVRGIALDVQVRIAAPRRPYDDATRDRLADLFGGPETWSRGLRSLHWTTLGVQVPPFTGETVVELPVTCTYDLEVSAAKYFDALADGQVPLEFLFSGSVFYAAPDGALRVGRIVWDDAAEFRLPVAAWRDMMNRFFGGAAWLRLGRDRFERLCAYKASHTLLTWDEVVDSLLEGR